jgi:hypothetical protein
MSSNLLKTFAIVALSVAVLFYSSVENNLSDQFSLQDDSLILTAVDTNHAGHVYPYMATTVTMGCLLVVLLLIICLGGQLG